MDVFVAGVGMTRFGPQADRSVKALAGEALSACLRDSGVEVGQIGAAFYSNVSQGVIEGQTSIPGQVALGAAGLEGVAIVNVENACASGASALWLARQHIASGAAEFALAVGVEKMNYADEARRAAVMSGFGGGMDVEKADATMDALLALGGEPPAGGGGRRSKFMDVYSALCRAHMQRFGTTQRQLAAIASKNHAHAVHNEKCHYRAPMSIDEVLASRPIGFPLTVAMCSPLSDGAAAVLLASKAGVERLSRGRPRVRLAASQLRSATTRAYDDFDRHVVRRAAEAAYAEAGVGPEDVDVAEVHDATAFGEVTATEMLGLCPLGEGGAFAESGATSIGGRVPVNPSGGLESKGHPIGATGLAQVCELVEQLRGEAGPRQVENARVAIQENGGGLLGVEEAAAVVSILVRD